MTNCRVVDDASTEVSTIPTSSTRDSKIRNDSFLPHSKFSQENSFRYQNATERPEEEFTMLLWTFYHYISLVDKTEQDFIDFESMFNIKNPILKHTTLTIIANELVSYCLKIDSHIPIIIFFKKLKSLFKQNIYQVYFSLEAIIMSIGVESFAITPFLADITRYSLVAAFNIRVTNNKLLTPLQISVLCNQILIFWAFWWKSHEKVPPPKEFGTQTDVEYCNEDEQEESGFLNEDNIISSKENVTKTKKIDCAQHLTWYEENTKDCINVFVIENSEEDHPQEMKKSQENRFCLCGQVATYVCPCSFAVYCSRTCQQLDWSRHKPECKNQMPV